VQNFYKIISLLTLNLHSSRMQGFPHLSRVFRIRILFFLFPIVCMFIISACSNNFQEINEDYRNAGKDIRQDLNTEDQKIINNNDYTDDLEVNLSKNNLSLESTKRSEKKVLPKIQIEDLLGKDFEKIFSLLGRPVLKRHEPPAEVWQYRSEKCIFDIVFYSNNSLNKSPETKYFEARNYQARPVDPSECLLDIVAINSM